MQFIYLIISIYYGRKNPLFFLIFPLALMQGPGALIDTRTVLVAPEFFLLGKNILKDITIFYLIGVIIYLKERIDFSLVYKTPMKWLMLYIIFLIFVTLASSGTSFEAIAVIRLFLYMVLGYYLLVLLFSATTYEQFIQFFNILFWVNAVQSVLYVLNSSKAFPIFDDSMLYREVESGVSNTGSFYRDFLTIPLLSDILFIYGLTSVLLNEKVYNRKAIYATLITYPFVLLFTFTRSMLLSTGLEIFIVFIILMRFRPSKVLRPYLLLLIIGAMMLFGVVKNHFKNEFSYFNNRIEAAATEGTNESNVNIRIEYHKMAWEILSRNNALWLGTGLNKRHDSEMDSIGAWAGDSTIPFLLLYTGIIGVLIYYSTQMYFLLMSLRNSFFKVNSLIISLFSIICVSFLSSLLMGGNSWGNPLIFKEFALIIFVNYLYHKKSLNKINLTQSSHPEVVY